MSAPANSIAFELPENIIFTKEHEQFIVQLTNLYNKISKASNSKDIGVYETIEQLNGQKYFSASPQIKRNVYRKVFNIGAIATGATSTTAHGITGQTIFTRIYGTVVTDVVDYRPIPYVSVAALNQQMSLTVTAANIVIVSGAAFPNVTDCYVVLEFLKQ